MDTNLHGGPNGASDGRKSLAIEPMTCPPDAFNSGRDLILIKPAQTYVLSWRITFINKNQ